jgi:hypothetical protein
MILFHGRLRAGAAGCLSLLARMTPMAVDYDPKKVQRVKDRFSTAVETWMARGKTRQEAIEMVRRRNPELYLLYMFATNKPGMSQRIAEKLS